MSVNSSEFFSRSGRRIGFVNLMFQMMRQSHVCTRACVRYRLVGFTQTIICQANTDDEESLEPGEDPAMADEDSEEGEEYDGDENGVDMPEACEHAENEHEEPAETTEPGQEEALGSRETMEGAEVNSAEGEAARTRDEGVAAEVSEESKGADEKAEGETGQEGATEVREESTGADEKAEGETGQKGAAEEREESTGADEKAEGKTGQKEAVEAREEGQG